MKALFIGLGSVGQRHLRNFRKICPEAPTAVAFRTSKSNLIIEDGKVKECDSLARALNFKEYNKLEAALKEEPEIGFVCNPTSEHVNTAIKLAEKGIHLFIEKPLSNSYEKLDQLDKLVLSQSLVTMVGYQTRFNPLISKIKSWIDDRTFGGIVNADFLWGTYLPDHHSYEDYREGYAARSDLGGGVVLGLSHELDLVHYLFGQPNNVCAIEGGQSKLAMDVEDTVASLLSCKTAHNSFPVVLKLSYAQGAERRRLSILFQEALLECDLVENLLQVVDHNKNIVDQLDYKDLDRNDLFMAEMKHFIDAVQKAKRTDISIDEGRKSLNIALMILRALNKIK